ncbi:MAG: GNAT family N-acetyltransferase [Thalassotalea sp.]|nr:GNAT family N-acetyltransferase [Thalassotalea sp.]
MEVTNSQRLKYRQMSNQDADLFYLLDQDPLVMKYLNGGKASTYDDINNVFLPRLNSYRNIDKGWGIWKVSITESDDFIGWILVRPMDFFSESPQYENLELGWRFMQKSWGKGYATEAAKHIMHNIIEQMRIYKFSALAVHDNKASIKVMTNIGMSYLKSYRHKDPLLDVDVVCYQINCR